MRSSGSKVVPGTLCPGDDCEVIPRIKIEIHRDPDKRERRTAAAGELNNRLGKFFGPSPPPDSRAPPPPLCTIY